MSPLPLGDYIVDLLAIISAATELPGGWFEVDVPVGPVAGAYQSRKLSTEQFVAYLQTKLQAPALTVTLELATAQTNLANGQPNGGAGVEHLLVGNWNASGDSNQLVAVHAADEVRFRTNGTLYQIGQPAQEVLVDVAAGTAMAVLPPPPGRDIYAIGDNAAVVVAVTAAGHTWTKGDLLAYGTAGQQAAGAPPAPAGAPSNVLAGTADVAPADTFDSLDAAGSAWRYTYRRRNDGTLGWTRIGK